MSQAPPLHLEFRVARWLVERSPSEVELMLTTFDEPITSLVIELHSPAVENGVAERRMEQFTPPHTYGQIERMGFRPAEYGQFPNAKICVIATTERGKFEGWAELRSTIIVSVKPDALPSIGDKAFYGVICDGPLNLPVDPTFNQMLQHHFDEAQWERLDFTWDSRAATRDLKPGYVFAKRFTLVKALGAGGMGAVWLATDSWLKDEKIALKFLPEELCHNPGAIDDLREEVLKARKLAHDHIVRIFDLIEHEGTAAISMEYIDGLTLDAYRRTLPNKVLEVDDLLPLLPGLSKAIDYAHENRIVHQDLKPMNLMLTKHGVLKVMDFGLAGTLSETKTRLSRINRGTVGTTPYMSPQQFESSIPSKANDIYSLGVILYELLTRKPPFYGEGVQAQIMNGKLQSMTERRAIFDIDGKPIPAAWDDAVLQALSTVAAQRPKTAAELCGKLIAGARPRHRRGEATGSAAASDSAKSGWQSPGPTTPPPPPPSPPPAEPAAPERKGLFGRLFGAFSGASASTKLTSASISKRLSTVGNSLGMKFVHFADYADNSMVLGCVHQTRTRDYCAFMESHERTYHMVGNDADDWQMVEYNGWPVGRAKSGAEADVSTSTHPVVCVNFHDVQAFCEWLTRSERSQGLIGPRDRYRLPSDAEWSVMVGLGPERGDTPKEKSANGPKNEYPWGRDFPPTKKVGNYADETAKAAGTCHKGQYIAGYNDGFATTAPVGSFPANKRGFYDLGGNAWEWCDDEYDGVTNCQTLRGAAWYGDSGPQLLSSSRFNSLPGLRLNVVGFRCVLVVESGGK